MNEIDLLELFHDEMRVRGITKEELFLSIDENLLAKAQAKYKQPIRLEQMEQLADICFANEWLLRTTVDPYYHYLSLSEAGLQIVLVHRYKKEI